VLLPNPQELELEAQEKQGKEYVFKHRSNSIFRPDWTAVDEYMASVGGSPIDVP
jgi:hypothetical protein